MKRKGKVVAALLVCAIPLLSQTPVNGKRDFAEIATPSNPSAGFARVYGKAGSGLCALNSSGVERCTGSGGIKTFTCDFSGNGGTVAINSTCYTRIPDGGTITGWSIVATGSSPTCT